jgi:DNA adenine methylase
MRYLGGKTRNAKWIADEIKKRRKPGQLFVEPFCGGLSVSIAVGTGPMELHDVHPGLINLYNGLMDGSFEMPKDRCTRAEYEQISKNLDPTNPYHTMVGFGLSYAGKWWGGYDSYYDSRGKQGKTWEMLTNSLGKKMKSLPTDVSFACTDYRALNPVNAIVYADPPYGNSTTYGFLSDPFDHDEFWDVMRLWSKNNTVLVSEYNAPEDFVPVKEAKYKVQMCAEQQERTEKLFEYNEK